jgi:hypothetical protein
MSGRTALVLIPMLAVALFSGCTAAAPPTQTSTPGATPSLTVAPSGTPYHVNVPQAVQGKYSADIARSTVSSGHWTMEITHNEIMVKNPAPDAQPFPVGVTDITPDHITFIADPECTPGSPHQEGTYSYALVNNELRFTVINDLCVDRRALLTAGAWARQP